MQETFVIATINKIHWLNLDDYQKEQIAFRSYICKDCIENNKCQYCRCKVHDALSDVISCNNGKKFPNLMNRKKWETYKEEHNITVK